MHSANPPKAGRSIWFIEPRAWLMLWIPIVLISFFHYSTAASQHWLHDIFRRMYYIPIVLGAFSYGIKGGLSASLLASLRSRRRYYRE